MADISRYPFVDHLRSSATAHVLHLRRGQVSHSGTGQSFWCRPMTSVLSEVPVDDREVPVLFRGRTIDFQLVTVQGTLTFRLTDPALAAARIDFSIDPAAGRWRGTPLEQVSSLLTESAQQQALDLLSRMPLNEAMAHGLGAVREAVSGGLARDPRLAETGIVVIGVRITSIRPEPEVEKAMQTPMREQVQQEADRATYERRAVAVERERAISENELVNQIELSRREEQLVAQRGTNARREAEEAAAAAAVRTASEADRTQRLGEADALARRSRGAADAAAETALVAAYRDLPVPVLMTLAAKDLAANLPQVQNLTLTPDLVSSALARMAAAPGTPDPSGNDR